MNRKEAHALAHDKPINLLRILKSNDVQDMLWCLRCTLEDNFKVRLLMSADFAESVLKHFTKYDKNDRRPADAIQAARDLANGKINEAAAGVAGAAGVAAGDAAWAARDAAWDAAVDAQADRHRVLFGDPFADVDLIERLMGEG